MPKRCGNRNNPCKRPRTKFWLDALSGGGSSYSPDTDPDTVFDFNPETTAVGDVVSYTSKGKTLTPTSSARRPATVAGELDGKKVFRFVLNDNFRGPKADWNFMHQSENTIVLLMKHSNTGAIQTLFNTADAAGEVGRYTRILANNFTSENLYNGSGVTQYLETGKHVVGTGWSLFVLRFQANAKSYAELDNIETWGYIEPTSDTLPAAASTEDAFWFIRSTGANSFVGDVARCLVFNKALTDDKLDQVIAYLKTEFPTAITFHDRPKWKSNGKSISLGTVTVVNAPVTNPDYEMMPSGFLDPLDGVAKFKSRVSNGHNTEESTARIWFRKYNGGGAYSSPIDFRPAPAAGFVETNPTPFLRLSNGHVIDMNSLQVTGTSVRQPYLRVSNESNVSPELCTWTADYKMTDSYNSPGHLDGPNAMFELDGYIYKPTYGRTTGSGIRPNVLWRTTVANVMNLVSDPGSYVYWEEYSTIQAGDAIYAWEEPLVIKRWDNLYLAFIRSDDYGQFLCWSWDLQTWSSLRHVWNSVNKPAVAIDATNKIMLFTGRQTPASPVKSSIWGYSNDGGRTVTASQALDADGEQEGSANVLLSDGNFISLWSSEVGTVFTRTVTRGGEFTVN